MEDDPTATLLSNKVDAVVAAKQSPIAMRILSWNTCCMGNLWGVRSLQILLKKVDPNFVFLRKTKVFVSDLLSKKISFGFLNGVALDCEERSGGLPLLWKHDVDLTVYQYLKNHIYEMLSLGSREESFWITGVYGHLEPYQRPEVWNLLRTLKNNEWQPWLAFGDINEVLKKCGGRTRGEGQMGAFCDCLTNCDLNNLRDPLGIPFPLGTPLRRQRIKPFCFKVMW